MSKPSYAAVAAKSTEARGEEAPPPYSGPSNHAQQPQHVAQPQASTTGHVESQALGNGQYSWVPPPSLEVARSRAKRRFWVAFFWAWVIWILLGLVVGGGVSDVDRAPPGRHGHWDRNGRWHDDWSHQHGGNVGAGPEDEWPFGQ